MALSVEWGKFDGLSGNSGLLTVVGVTMSHPLAGWCTIRFWLNRTHDTGAGIGYRLYETDEVMRRVVVPGSRKSGIALSHPRLDMSRVRFRVVSPQVVGGRQTMYTTYLPGQARPMYGVLCKEVTVGVTLKAIPLSAPVPISALCAKPGTWP